MKSKSDSRRLRIKQLSIADGEIKSSNAGDAWQEGDGTVKVSGLWDGVVPLMPEDMKIRAARVGISTLEWFRKRLLSSPMIEVEVIN